VTIEQTPDKFRGSFFMVSTNRLAYWAVILGLFIPSIMGQAAAADRPGPYIGLYGGLTIPEQLQDVRGTGEFSGLTFTDLKLARSAILGAKLGFFRSPKSWLGVETEFFYTNPHVKQQDFTGTGPGGSLTQNFAGAHIRMATWALNLIARYPGERFQPYAGVGFGIFWARLSGPDFATSADVSPGLNALGGMRFALTERLALFGEYKYNQAAFDFGRDVNLHALYQAHHFVGGLSLLF
jgi:opacity protein-like surface antigen